MTQRFPQSSERSFQLSEPLAERWSHWQQRFADCFDEAQQSWFGELQDSNPDEFAQLAWLCSCSDFVAEYLGRYPGRFRELLDSGELARPFCIDKLKARASDIGDQAESEEQFAAALRQLRNRQMVAIIWRDFVYKHHGNTETFSECLAETTAAMTALAETCLQTAHDYLYRRDCEKYGTPIGNESGQPQQLVVLGMGKLGAGELNLSSDIDLIFAYPESGDTRFDEPAKRRTRSNQEFFERLGRNLIQLLDNRTADGFVFRMDMRLRPFGSSGPLVMSFDGLENYYQTQGRDWERFAMIKARPVAGDLIAGQELMTRLRPFTYRKYIDFSVIQALREIKGLIAQEVHRSGVQQDVKRGAGGIREVEFIAQAFQLIRGGRDPRLQRPELLTILPLLDELQLLPAGKSVELAQAYCFLRQIEHALQGVADQQTQQLPTDPLGQTRVAELLGFADWSTFYDSLTSYQAQVEQLFEDVVAEPVPGESSTSASMEQATQVWRSYKRQQTDEDALTALGYQETEAASDTLQQLLASKALQQMQAEGQKRLDQLMPALISGCGEQAEAAQALTRTFKLVESVARRSAYLLLLIENPTALKQLIILCAASKWIAEQLVTHPALLDELLDPRTLYKVRSKNDVADELRQLLLRIPEEDEEALLEAMRYFKLSNTLRVAACEVTGALPLMKASDNLTWIAEVLLEQVQDQAWRQLVAKYGEPGCVDGGEQPGFLIVGYGKLGGIELGYSSDLDLVFLYDADQQSMTTGNRSVDNATFFLRLGQRIIHLLTAKTVSGELYEVDMRLRPSGNSGMLVTSFNGFVKYQRESAWTWEHQALVRARAITGSEALVQRFNQQRTEILCRPRELEALKTEVLDMRAKMAAHLDRSGTDAEGAEYFDIKQGRGGIVDIEFMVQFAVLAWAETTPELARWSDNIRLLESLAARSELTVEERAMLIETYQAYRVATHRAQLQQQQALVDGASFSGERAQIQTVWQRLLGDYQPVSQQPAST